MRVVHIISSVLIICQVIILPISATRWASFTEHSSNSAPAHEVPFWLTAAAASLFKLGGVIDVLLFAFTRPNVLLFGASRDAGTTERTVHSVPTSFQRCERSWSNCLRKWKSRDTEEAGGEAETNAIEMQDMPDRSEARPQSGALLREENGREVAESRIQLIVPQRAPADIKVRREGYRLSSRPSGPGLNQQEPLALDLNEEFDYRPAPTSFASLGSPRHASPLHVQAGSNTNSERFQPLFLDLPDPRISGLSGIDDPWMSAQREERLAFSEPPSASIRDSAVTVLETRSSGNGDVVLGGSPSARELSRELSDTLTGRDVPGENQEKMSGTVETGNLARDSPASGNSVPSKYGKQELVLEDPFRTSPTSRHDTGHTLTSRERRVRGPRPLPTRKSSSSSDILVSRPRPARPTIGIPSPTSLRSTPSPQSSSRSPRMRFPQSALEAIPEHRLLGSFQPASPQLLRTVPSTTPLSFRNKRPSSRPRSLSDGSDRSAPRKGRPKYTSFIDVRHYPSSYYFN